MEEKTRQALIRENENLRQEVNDLRLLLEAATGHSDGMESDLLEKINVTVRDSEKKFRLITETIPLPIFISRASDGVILYANMPAGSLLNQSPESLIGRKTTEFYDPDDRLILLDTIARQGRVKGTELKINNGRGTDLWAEFYIEKMAFGEEDCLLVILRDITERRIMEKQLRQSQKMEAIGTLAGGIAHDFNNILAGIMGYAEMASGLSGKNTRIYNYLEEILSGCTRSRDLVRRILTFSQQTEHEFRSVQFRPIIKETVRLLRSSLPATIIIREDIRTNAHVFADPTQIHQVLMNLCTNAKDAMREEGGTLSVELADVRINERFTALYPDIKHGLYACLTVSDTGCGMTADVQKRIFDPFFTTKAVGEGTGLGLSVIHGIVKNHEGAIIVHSKPGKGTIFRVYLPMAREQQPSETMQSQGNTTGSEHILLIDDDLFIIKMAKRLLLSLGYKVTAAMDTTEARNIFRSDPTAYDLIITDMTMPKMTGDKLASKLLKIRPDIPIILCTGDDIAIRKEDILKTGVKALLTKPFSLKEIAITIRDVLN
ncbi:ATP-binding protein [Desulfococcaceae bacterium HSG8]|nr:ATP-binding protein [Desulfococcaceae bacterium HSG8]